MKRLHAPSILVPLLIAAGCADAPDPEAARIWAERDSAGVTVVENRVTALDNAGWSVGDAPQLTIGGLDAPEETQLFQVDGATRLADGRLAVGATGTHDVRVFSPQGALLARFGSEGDGPGEFRDVTLLGRYGADTLVVFDASSSRISHLTPDDGFLGSSAVSWDGKGFPIGRGLLDDGAILIGGGMSFSSSEGFPTGVIRPLSTFGWIDRDGGNMRALGDFAAAGMFAQASDQGFMARGLPFTAVTAAAPGLNGVWLGTGERWEVGFYDLHGVLVRRVRTDTGARPVTPELRRAYEEEEVADASSDNEARQIRDLMAEMPFPAEMPPYQVLMTDALGYLWVEEYVAPGQDRPTWLVFDPQGHAVARLRTPPRTRVLEIGEDYVLGRSLDDMDVETLTLWPLRRVPPAS